jgi:hypothetical protein
VIRVEVPGRAALEFDHLVLDRNGLATDGLFPPSVSERFRAPSASLGCRMLRDAALGILVIGREGAAVRSLLAADLVVSSIEDALDLLGSPKRLVASLHTA